MKISDLTPWTGKKSLTHWREENPVDSLHKEMNRLVRHFFNEDLRDVFEIKGETFSPRIDVIDKDNEIKVVAELPGMDEKDIDVNITRNILTLKGEKKEEKEDRRKNYYRTERSFGEFYQTINLPVEVETDKIEANFKKGILTVTMPKSAKVIEETKKIEISAK